MTTCTSTFIATTTKTFWTHAEHMHIFQCTADGFKLEGIDEPEDLFEFSADDLHNLFKSMKKPVRSVDDRGDCTAANPMHISAKSKKRIIVTANAVEGIVLISTVGVAIVQEGTASIHADGIDVKVLAIYRRLNLSTSVCLMFFK